VIAADISFEKAKAARLQRAAGESTKKLALRIRMARQCLHPEKDDDRAHPDDRNQTY
jgi:hypothetical protein